MKKLLLSLLLSSGLVAANDYNKGVDAYKSGDYKSALQYWKPYADKGDAKTQYYIGNLYYEGKGNIEQDYKKALYWYREAAVQEHARSQLRIGLMYCKGEGVLKSFKNAAPYVRSAYENGCKKAPEAWNKYELWKYE